MQSVKQNQRGNFSHSELLHCALNTNKLYLDLDGENGEEQNDFIHHSQTIKPLKTAPRNRPDDTSRKTAIFLRNLGMQIAFLQHKSVFVNSTIINTLRATRTKTDDMSYCACPVQLKPSRIMNFFAVVQYKPATEIFYGIVQDRFIKGSYV